MKGWTLSHPGHDTKFDPSRCHARGKDSLVSEQQELQSVTKLLELDETLWIWQICLDLDQATAMIDLMSRDLHERERGREKKKEKGRELDNVEVVVIKKTNAFRPGRGKKVGKIIGVSINSPFFGGCLPEPEGSVRTGRVDKLTTKTRWILWSVERLGLAKKKYRNATSQSRYSLTTRWRAWPVLTTGPWDPFVPHVMSWKVNFPAFC